MRLCLSVLAGMLALAFSCSSATARVPHGFVGMNADSPLFDPGVDTSGQLNRMVEAGVESMRVTFNWAAAQPYASWSDVPTAQTSEFQDIGGIPTNFADTDEFVTSAAQRGLQLLPTVLYAPGWDVKHHPPGTFGVPISNTPYANYLQALVRRYGPHGSYWHANPDIPYRPVRMWQIWNEPDIPTFWATRPFAPSYVALLRVAHAAIKNVDPGAKVVLAGLPNFSWIYLKQIYKLAGARAAFDVVAVHPYTAQPSGVITVLDRVRAAMNNAGDGRKPMLVTEGGWSSSGTHEQPWDTTPAQQASRLKALIPLLASNRNRLRLLGFYYFTWVSQGVRGQAWSHFAGLFRYSNHQFIVKPAFSAFRTAALELEACRQKASLATGCLKPALSH